jgi:hypothetical protein
VRAQQGSVWNLRNFAQEKSERRLTNEGWALSFPSPFHSTAREFCPVKSGSISVILDK